MKDFLEEITFEWDLSVVESFFLSFKPEYRE
jgi:hypothetical protein